MSNQNDGGPAFPVPAFEYMNESGSERTVHKPWPGITLRDYFAAKAMAALMPIYWETQDEYESGAELMKCQVASAYEYADAMLAERSKAQ